MISEQHRVEIALGTMACAIHRLERCEIRLAYIQERLDRLDGTLDAIESSIREIAASQKATLPQALANETKTHVDTIQAAAWLDLTPRTLRGWAARGKTSIQPSLIDGQLAWPVEEIRMILFERHG